MKKILIVVNNLNIGGAENVAVTQANFLSKKGYDIYFGLLYNTTKKETFYDKLELEKNKVIHFTFSNLFDSKGILGVYKFLRKNKIDVAMGHLFESNTVLRVASILARTPKVFITEHSCYDIKSRWQIIVDRLLSYFTDKIIAVSEEVKDFTAKQEGIKKEKFLVLNQICDLRLKNKFTREELRKKYDISDSALVVITVGRLSPEKNQVDIIKIAEKIKEKKDIYFFIVGYGKEELLLRKEIKNRGLKNINIIVDPRNAKEYLVLGDIFIMTSNREGMPVAMLEAMYNGLPAISYDIGGVSDILEDNVNGFLVKFGEIGEITKKIEFLNSNNGELVRLKKEAVRIAKGKNGKIENLEKIINN